MSMRILLAAISVTMFASANGTVAQDAPLNSDSLLQQIEPVQKKLSLVGMGATVLVDGKVIASAVCGRRCQKSEIAVAVNDKWHLGSITKAMTATVVARLVEQGELAWDSPLPVMLPEMAEQMHVSWDKVTLHHLLTHSAGLPRDFPMTVQFSRPKDLKKLHQKRRDELSAVLAEPATTPPGESHAYSNVGYTLAGFIAAEKRSMTWEALIEQELFAPLKIQSAGFGPPLGSEPLDQPWGHQRVFFMRNPVDPSKHGDNSPVIGPAGIVHMSMGDLSRFGWEHLLGESSGTPLLKQETFQKLHAAAINDYAYGWVDWSERDWTGGRVIWHNGTNTMWYSVLMLIPSKNAVLVIVTNDGHLGQAPKAFFDLAESIVAKLPTVDKTHNQ